MRAIISTTSDDLYLYNLPIVTWAWKQIGVDVICFAPKKMDAKEVFVLQTANCASGETFRSVGFVCQDNKAATYAQCSRLYGAALFDLPSDEVLITSDADMLPFKPLLDLIEPGRFNLIGTDLVPEGQFAMCYASGTVAQWRDVMKIGGRSYQQCLDDLLGHIESDNMKGNYWAKDQEELWLRVGDAPGVPIWPVERARPGTQLASNRLDRDDIGLLDRLSPSIVDYHLNRPLWNDANHTTLMAVLQYYWPHEDFGWLEAYRETFLSYGTAQNQQ